MSTLLSRGHILFLFDFDVEMGLVISTYPSPSPDPSSSSLHCLNGDGPFNGQNGYSPFPLAQWYTLTEMEMETVRVNKPKGFFLCFWRNQIEKPKHEDGSYFPVLLCPRSIKMWLRDRSIRLWMNVCVSFSSPAPSHDHLIVHLTTRPKHFQWLYGEERSGFLCRTIHFNRKWVLSTRRGIQPLHWPINILNLNLCFQFAPIKFCL